nr:unnamed protein product [Callosobruchus analis]
MRSSDWSKLDQNEPFDKTGLRVKRSFVTVARCLHICSSAAASKLPNSVEQFVRDIHSYFSQRSIINSELRECQIFAEEKPHKLLYPSQTR